jgi:DNA-binding transcriptional regulator YiaG
MTPDEFKSARLSIGLTQIKLGQIHLGKSLRTVRRYEQGQVEIPALVAEKMAELVKRSAKKSAA